MPVCRSCGQENPGGFRFCGSCGASLETAALAANEERRIVTVLFADLVGFTSTAERLDPEDVRELLEPVYARLRHELVKLDGIVEKFIGDAVMAIFGAPVAHEDDPERAVRAALAIRDAIAQLSEEEGSPALSVRIGINTGEALVALDVAPHEGERIVADFVNVAARLQVAAPVDGILVGEATYRATQRAIEYREFEAVMAKGKAEPVEAWEALAARARGGYDPYERGRVPLVGRDAEIELLCDVFARTRREHSPQLVTIVGAPGLGKSRLVFELSSVVEDDPDLVYWRRGSCPPYGERFSFWPLAEMVKAQAGVLETDTVEVTEEKLGAAVRDVIEGEDEARWIEARLRPLVGLTGGELPDGRVDEDFTAWRRFFEALAGERPVVMIFEDLHWADDGLLDFVEYLVDWATGLPLLIICVARPELLGRRPGWGEGKANALTIMLSPLSDEETAALLAELLEQAVMPAGLQSQLLARAGGNPLYAEEFIRMLSERGAEAEGDLPLPESVQGIIAARLDVLPLDERTTLQNAAVVGRFFWAEALERLSSQPRSTLEDHLRSLERKQLVRRLRRSSVEGETEYTFRHLLVRDVAYGRIPRARRAEKHELAAAWLESLGRLEDQAEMVAHHYLSALELAQATGRGGRDLDERARLALAEAGDRAASLNGFQSAVRFYDAALGLWQRDEPGWADIRLRQGRALFFSAESGEDVLAEARNALLALGRSGDAAEAESMIGHLAFGSGERDRSLLHYDRALALLADAPPSASKASVLGTVARSLVVATESEEGLRVGREALAMAEKLGLDDLRAKQLITIGDARIELGDLGGMDDFERGIEIALEANSAEAASGLINQADTLMDLGDLERASERRSEAGRAAERFGDAKTIRWLRAERCGELYWFGRWREALPIADAFIDESERGPRHYQETYCRVVRGRIRLARGDVSSALEDAARGLDFGRQVKDPQAFYPTLAFSARALLLAGREQEAEAAASELLDLVDGTTKTPVAYLWLLDLAACLAGLERGDELIRALALVRKPTPWLEAARAVASGTPEAAAAVYAAIGARPDEALARLLATEALLAAGRRAEAEAQLEQALAFYRGVGAPASVSWGERLMATR